MSSSGDIIIIFIQALLEKNEDLSKENEKIAEEFSQKLEVKHQAINQ